MNWEKDDGKNLALIFVLSTNRIQFRIIIFFFWSLLLPLLIVFLDIEAGFTLGLLIEE